MDKISKKRCFHVMHDEKIINRTIEMFEDVYPFENFYIVIYNESIKYVKSRDNVCFINSSKCLTRYIDMMSEYSYLIIHNLGTDIARILLNVKNENICWIEWGGDLYHSLLEIKGYKLYEPYVEQHLKNSSFLKNVIIKPVRLKYYQSTIVNFAKKVKYFMPDGTPDEYPLILKYYPSLNHLKYKEFFYYPIDYILGQDIINKRTTGVNIFVNHSANLTGNHVGIYKRLSELNLGCRKVFSPISYGEDPDFIESEGKQILGERYVPLKEFISLEEYNNLLLSAGVFIYGHWRQEAVGNILIALYIGGKVFLSNKNPLFDYYKRMGIKIWEISELNDEEINSPVPETILETNRKILMQLYSKKRLLSLIKNDFDTVVVNYDKNNCLI